jgi:Na+-driven multidrug efflux pump
MIVSFGRQIVVLLPAAWILAQVGGLNAIWWAFPIAETMSVALSLFFFRRIYRNIISQLPEE